MPHDHILRLIEALAGHRGKSNHTVGAWASGGDGALYSRLLSGRSITTHRAARVIQWFDKNWPEDLPWPEDVPRPPQNARDDAA